jgi:integrase
MKGFDFVCHYGLLFGYDEGGHSMDLENLRANSLTLLTRLEADGYSDVYVARVRCMIKTILDQSDAMGWNNYHEVFQHYENSERSQDNITKKRTVIGAIMEFDLNGKFPDRTPSQLVERGAYCRLLPEFKLLIDYFKEHEQRRGMKASSIDTLASNASSFFLRAQEAGATELKGITEEMMLTIFLPPDGGRGVSAIRSKPIASVLDANVSRDPHTCLQVLNILPVIKKMKRNIQYLTEQEGAAVLRALDDMSNTLTFRDRAIGKLAYFTGLRSSDIVALELSSINWKRDLITLKQQKTDAALNIPLRAPVGNAIFDYLIKERPKTQCPDLFLTRNKPYRKLSDAWNTSAVILAEAGVRQADGDRKGLHIFRRHMATGLMNRGVPHAVISNLLGHTSPSSLEPYLSADIKGLRNCALCIARFPVDEEVFTNA